jgi:hypothetical protein
VAADARSPEWIVERARAQAGLEDFGSDSYREGLEIVVRANEAAAAPQELRERVYSTYVDVLVNRLRVTDYWKRHPELAAQRIERPLIVLGMPRSGTTLTSYLLDQDPARRSLLVWEAFDSVPPPTTETLRTDARCLARLEAQRREWESAPGQVRPHVEFADGPTECLRLHAADFKALWWEAFMPVPEYSRWMMDVDMTSAYAYERQVLQVLQSQAPGTWSLKMPSHALHIEWVLKAFPDARFVWTHRDPYRSLNSLFSMKSRAWQRGTGDPGLGWLREHYVGQLSEHVNRPRRLRERIGDAQFYDLHYADLVRDPIEAMQRLYRWAGDGFTPDVEARMSSWLEENPQGRFGKHDYSLEQFGLTKAALEPYFGDYVSAYGVEPEG